jgi:sodium transport system permease protein
VSTIFTVFRKELLDTWRDRRTIMFMVIIPLLLFPVLFKIMFAVQETQADKERVKMLRVACLAPEGAAQRLVEMLRAGEGVVVVADVPRDSVRAFTRDGRLDGAFVVDDDFDASVSALGPGRIDFYYKSADDQGIARGRLRRIAEKFEEALLAERFEQLGLERDVVEGVDLRTHNVASTQEQIGKRVGGFLPYIFVLFCFMGAMYPAIDLGAGEKERGTLETLLTAPVNRFHILLGKFGVVVLSGLVSAVVSITGLFIGVRQMREIPEDFFGTVTRILGVETILLILSLLLPLTIFFAGVLLSVSLTARSFKEAQSMISPLNIAIIVPAAVGMLPGVELNAVTAMIPVLNVSLATKEIIAGTIDGLHLALVYTSLVGLAVLGLWGATQWFRRESTIFRS